MIDFGNVSLQYRKFRGMHGGIAASFPRAVGGD
jgi:hypothetical protein